MHFHRLDADAEHVGDLLVELANDDEVEHFTFALGELLHAARGVGLEQAFVAGLALELQALFDQAQHVALAERLLDEVHRALLQRRHRHRHVAVPGDEDHRQTATPAAEFLEQLEAAHARHAHIEHDATDHVGRARGQEGFARFVGGNRVAIGFEHPCERIAQGFVVVDDVNNLVRRCGHYAHWLSPSAG